jgi:phosphatidylglycerol:prolipoprotein diacylglycerol transferase
VIPYFAPVSYELPLIHIHIHLFGLLVAVGIMLAVPQVLKRGRQLGLDPLQLSSLCTWVVVCGFVVSHLFDVLAYQPAAVRKDPWLIVNITGGISSFGGFLGAFVTTFVWSRVKRWSFAACCDALVYGLATGWFFGRLGCFTAHDHPGTATHFFLGVNFGNHEPFGVHHDLGLYEALYALALMIAFRILVRRPRPVGFYSAIAALSYGPVRFGLDFLRIADERYLGLTPAQYGSILVFLGGVAVAAMIRRIETPPAST